MNWCEGCRSVTSNGLHDTEHDGNPPNPTRATMMRGLTCKRCAERKGAKAG